MIIIREQKNSSGHLCYQLKELITGREQVWVPPQSMTKAEQELSLVTIGASMESAAQAVQDASYSYIPGVYHTLREAGEEFMLRKAIDLAENTRSCWQGCLNSRIYPALGDVPIQDIRPKHINDFLLGLKAEGLAHSTCIKYHTVLKHLFRCAKEDLEIIDKNIMDKVKRPKPRKSEELREKVDALTVDEVAKVLDVVQNEPLKWRAMVWLIADTGIRRGECCGIRWEDVNFANCQVQIRRSVGYTPEQGIYVDTPKNRKPRIVDVDPEVMWLLWSLYQERQGPWVFWKRKDPKTPMHPQSPTWYLSKYEKKCGIKVTPHKLRHTFASISILGGADILSISAILGHYDPSFTLRVYSHSNSDSRKKASDVCRKAIRTAISANATDAAI